MLCELNENMVNMTKWCHRNGGISHPGHKANELSAFFSVREYWHWYVKLKGLGCIGAVAHSH